MIFQKTLTIDNTDILFEVFTQNNTETIYNSVDVDDVLKIKIYGHNPSIENGDDGVFTKPSGLTEYQYRANKKIPNNAISLCNKFYSLGLETWTTTDLPTDLFDENFKKFQCIENNETDKTIDIFLIESFLYNINGKSEKTNLDTSSLYSIKFDIDKLFGTTTNEFLYIDFITSDIDLSSPNDSKFNSTTCNALNVLNNLDWFFDKKKIFSQKTSFDFNFKFTPFVENKILNDIIKIDNEKTIQDNLIKQYLSEYPNYFNSLETELKEQKNPNYDLLMDTKYILCENATLINSFTKGTIDGIERVIKLYGKNLKENIYTKVQQSLNGINFVYRITSNLPSTHWYSIIKDIVHPISWSEQYVYVDTDSSLPAYDIKNVKIEKLSKINNMSYHPDSYLNINNNNKIVYSDDFDLSNINSMNTNFNFNYKPQEYSIISSGVQQTVVYDINNNVFKDLLNDEKNFVVLSSEVINNSTVVTIKYLLNIALEYEFYITKNTSTEKYNSIKTNKTKATFVLNESTGTEIIFHLTLFYYEFEYTLTTTLSKTI